MNGNSQAPHTIRSNAIHGSPSNAVPTSGVARGPLAQPEGVPLTGKRVAHHRVNGTRDQQVVAVGVTNDLLTVEQAHNVTVPPSGRGLRACSIACAVVTPAVSEQT